MTANLALVIAIMAFLTGVLALLPRMARPTLPFGVRIPDSHTDAPIVRQATSRYYRELVLTMAVVAVALVALVFVVPAAVVATSAAFIGLAAWLVPYLAARRTILTAKHTEGWHDGLRQATVADTTWRTSPPRFPWAWAWPAMTIAVATLVAGIVIYPSLPDRIATHIGPDGPDEFAHTTIVSAFGLVGVQFLLTTLLFGLVAVILRSKPDIVASDPQVSADQYRRYSLTMAKSVLAVAAGTNVTVLIVALVVWEVLPATTLWTVVSIVPALATALIVTIVSVRTGQSGHRLRTTTAPRSMGETVDRDDDEYWIAGLFYRNHDDPSLWVPKRYGGTGWTINLARPTAWLIVGLTVVVAIGAPIVAVIAGSASG